MLVIMSYAFSKCQNFKFHTLLDDILALYDTLYITQNGSVRRPNSKIVLFKEYNSIVEKSIVL